MGLPEAALSDVGVPDVGVPDVRMSVTETCELADRVIAEAKLSHKGLSLAKVAATPGLGEQLVGPVTWPFIDPDRPRRRDSERKGVSVDTVNRMLTELDSIDG